ncbi:hypothetical protein [Planomicrobium sp. Y74]|uniref:hypothetical protein n=1 Tax=Planomicrobium sp. Y74 TaxID=2478977 RepID=UPI000EF518A3|nr:hypothetical protein [Planomicrobium sp. Y74]RLQ92730.1 hypothetical protein D9754_01540 [Planomicrobium sp. Y74]
MKQAIIFTLTFLVLGILNSLISILFDLNFGDVSIPLGVVCVGFAHSFTGGTSPYMRQSDMETRGETGIRMPFMNKAARTSFIFFGSLAYFLFALILTLFFYREYFIG